MEELEEDSPSGHPSQYQDSPGKDCDLAVSDEELIEEYLELEENVYNGCFETSDYSAVGSSSSEKYSDYTEDDLDQDNDNESYDE